MITSADVPEPKPEPDHRPVPAFSSQAGLASFTTESEVGCNLCGQSIPDAEPHVCFATDRENGSAER